MTEQRPPGPDPNVAPDPWKSFRGITAGTLILEAIVVLLALPVVAAADHGLTPLTACYLIGFAVVLVLLCGVQGRPWAIWVNLGIQVVLIAGWLVHGAVGFIGVMFTAEFFYRQWRHAYQPRDRFSDIFRMFSQVKDAATSHAE